VSSKTVISPALQIAQWSRRFLFAATALFVVGVLLGTLIGTEGFLFGAVIWFPIWFWCLALALVSLWQSSNSDAGRMARQMAFETLGALALMLIAEILVALFTNMLSVRVGLS
jgi:hypothetical protein